VGSRSESLYFYIVRAAIVMFCILLISGFLYSPYVSHCFKSQENLTIYTWVDMFDATSISAFEKQTGVKVNLVYYDNCEELITKLEISNGQNHDLILLADCSLGDLVKMDMLAPIDKALLDFWPEIEPRFLNRTYDLNNRYSVPYSWDVYGIGINTERFDSQMPLNSWNLIFDCNLALPKIGMMEDGLSAVVMAAQYLYGNVEALDQNQINEIKALLMAQKQLVEVYTSVRADYLLSSRASPVVVSQSACVYRAMENDDQIKFIIPQEGGFISTENFVILKSSTKKLLAHQFINFMYQKENVRKYIHKTMFLPMRRDVLYEMDLHHLGGQDILLDPKLFDKIAFFKYILPRQEITKLWIEVKAS